jgi:response regulator RpfG family c-di-GMP phosphodiesterase
MAKNVLLCVDDEQMVLRSLRAQMVKHFGDLYRYEIAESVSEAWEVIEELEENNTKILIIVSDWLMPGVRGDEFLIDVHKRFPAVVKILLTGQADESAINRARRLANLHAYISKPWTEEALIEVITSGLAGV